MTDYKELLRRAVETLPENNGAARRAVYEKARSALVGQLRAINPPLPAREITAHRLQLEDCIRQVEQEASEANIAGLTQEPPTLPPVFAAEVKKPAARPEPRPEPQRPAARAETPKPQPPKAAPPKAAPRAEPAAKPKAGNGGASIEDIIAAAERDRQRRRARPPRSSRGQANRSRCWSNPSRRRETRRAARQDRTAGPAVDRGARRGRERPSGDPQLRGFCG